MTHPTLTPVPMLIPTLTPVPSPTPTPSTKHAGTRTYRTISRVSERKKESGRMNNRTQKDLGVVAQYTTVSTTQDQWCCLTCRERGNATGFLNIIENVGEMK